MTAVIDAAALLAVLLDEAGAHVVIPLLRGSAMSAINLSECYSRGHERGMPYEAASRAIRRFEMHIVPFDATLALAAALLREPTRAIGASLGDRACLALGKQRAVPVFTADRRLATLHPSLGVDVRLIR